MNDSPPPQPLSPAQRRMRFELAFASFWLGVGLFLLPAAIYGVGAALLGAYGERAGLGKFYVDYFADLAEPSLRAWALALGPLVIVSLIRLIFIGARKPADGGAAPQEAVLEESHAAKRIEPRVSLD